MNATPRVAIVVHELPVSTDMTEHTAHVITRNSLGLNTFRPYDIRVGTTPDNIHVVATNAMHSSIGMAGRICEALRLNPTERPRREATPPTIESPSATAVDDNRINGPISETASAPLVTMTVMRATKRKLTGISEINNDGRFTPPKTRCLFKVCRNV